MSNERLTRQIVVRLTESEHAELKNAKARLGAPYGQIVRSALRRYLSEVGEEDIRLEIKRDNRGGHTTARARILLEQLKNE